MILETKCPGRVIGPEMKTRHLASEIIHRPHYVLSWSYVSSMVYGCNGKWPTQQCITAVVDSTKFRDRLDVSFATNGMRVKIWRQKLFETNFILMNCFIFISKGEENTVLHDPGVTFCTFCICDIVLMVFLLHWYNLHFHVTPSLYFN